MLFIFIHYFVHCIVVVYAALKFGCPYSRDPNRYEYVCVCVVCLYLCECVCVCVWPCCVCCVCMCGMCGMCVCVCMCVYIIPSLIYPKHVSTSYFSAHVSTYYLFTDLLWRLCCVVLYCVVLYCVVLYCIVLCCIVLCCIVLCCIVLCCIVLCCIVLYCVGLGWECTARELVPAARTQAPPMRFPVLAQRHETQRVALRMSFVRKDALDSLMSHSLFQW
jgi:hypothetical protein